MRPRSPTRNADFSAVAHQTSYVVVPPISHTVSSQVEGRELDASRMSEDGSRKQPSLRPGSPPRPRTSVLRSDTPSAAVAAGQQELTATYPEEAEQAGGSEERDDELLRSIKAARSPAARQASGTSGAVLAGGGHLPGGAPSAVHEDPLLRSMPAQRPVSPVRSFSSSLA